MVVSMLPGANVTVVSERESQKAWVSMSVTFAGMLMEVSPPLWKAMLPMLVTLSGIWNDVSEFVYINAAPPILVTLSGIDMELSDPAPMNA
jgi:hypothetical protein